ncbi:tRNA pseudouridine synthase 1 [Actinomortierella ambigua]|uniref:tRNA pseudouridine synthase 1 n=1 Tax=Actinomortierella ambigua TaxID=1343610 RepID=A0A9P6Q856_9FUNG|nr:tRNA pseudouridine synthase 1 [Actinomortierella ambigua]
MENSNNNNAEAPIVASAAVPAKRDHDTPVSATAATVSTPDSSNNETQTPGEGLSAKRQRTQVLGEDTSSYLAPRRSKQRGKIRGADKYKGKRDARNFRNDERQKREGSADEAGTEAGVDNDEDGESKKKRVPKRKIALLLGYSGTGYQGMQVNPGAKTIEGELFKAMCKAGAVSEDNADDIKKVSMMRSARTDKGVHAAGNVVSLKMIVEDKDIVAKINQELPEQIRVFGYARTINSFNAKVLCDSRSYEYLIPTYVFLPRPENLPASKAMDSDGKAAPAKVVIREDAPEGSNAWDENVHISTPEEMQEKRSYRISPETLETVRKGFAAYVGTRNFHNFTVGHHFKEMTCNRYIMKFDVSEPMMIHGTEWLSLKVHGQSFMLHQIRKMVGLIVMMVRTDTPLKLIPETFKENRINIPKAPSLGLLLERPHFGTYNRKIEQSHEKVEFDKYETEMQEFKEKHIYEGIFAEELTYNRFDEYLQILDGHAETYNFGYLNKEGTIPESAIIRRGDTQVSIEGDSDKEGSNDNDD